MKKIILILVSLTFFSSNTNADTAPAAQYLKYQSAAIYTHLNWSKAQDTAIKVKVLPITNFSGVPVEYREEDAEYFDHGKIPQSIEPLFSGLLNASQYFITNEIDADYKIQLSINRYQLPYTYAPNDSWWDTIMSNVDRTRTPPKSAIVSLSLRLTSKKRQMPVWSSTVQTSLNSCDLNAQTQKLDDSLLDPVIPEYSRSTTGQAFIAASNFLIIQAIEHINQTRGLARIVSKQNNELLLASDDYSFVIGETLGVYFRDKGNNHSGLPTGRIQIIKAFNNHAIAYPYNLRADQILAGDWVEVSGVKEFIEPRSSFSPMYQCNQEPISIFGY